MIISCQTLRQVGGAKQSQRGIKGELQVAMIYPFLETWKVIMSLTLSLPT